MSMNRTILLLTTGAVIGLAAYRLILVPQFQPSHPEQVVPSLFVQVLHRVTGQDHHHAVVNRALTAADHLHAYREAAGESDPDVLQALIERAVREPATALQRLRIETWLARLGELDPARAAAVALRLGLERRIVVNAFQSWAEFDGTGALGALAGLEDPTLRRGIAVGLLPVLGEDARSVAQVASALPPLDRVSFRMEAVESIAAHEPLSALRVALEVLDGESLRRAVQRIAMAAARVDPRIAMAQSALLPDNLQAQYRNGLTSEWARLDIEGFVAHIEAVRTLGRDLSGGLGVLLVTDPDRALALAERYPGELSSDIMVSAMAVRVANDPMAMVSRVADMPAGPQREQLMQSVAAGFARQNPGAALAWARQLNPPSQNAEVAVLSILASENPDRALELLLPAGAAGGAVNMQLLTSVASQVAFQAYPPGTDATRIGHFAERLAESPDPAASQALQSLMNSWGARDTDAAMGWLLANGEGIDANIVSSVVSRFARRDVHAAAAFVDQVPESMRATWITQVAGAYASHDVEGTINWLAQYQGQEGHATATRQVISQAAQSDPRMAAQLWAQAPADVRQTTTGLLAMHWARQDPTAAAGWAQSLSDERLRNQAVTTVTTQWGASDPQSARRWVQALPHNALRDQAVGSLLVASGSSGQLDLSLISMLTSDQAREQAVVRAVSALATSDPGTARALLDTYVTNPALRNALEQRIAPASGR